VAMMTRNLDPSSFESYANHDPIDHHFHHIMFMQSQVVV
jgi:hypothetical protein